MLSKLEIAHIRKFRLSQRESALAKKGNTIVAIREFMQRTKMPLRYAHYILQQHQRRASKTPAS